MTRDDIIRMAKEAGLTGLSLIDVGYLQSFATLVAAHEREECALILQRNSEACSQGSILEQFLSACAAAIRARGEA